MFYTIKTTTSNIDWEEIRTVIETAGLSSRTVEQCKTAFENSYLAVFILDNNKVIGTGRAISDGILQAGIYDIAVLPEYQKKGIGKIIMETLQESLKGINIILYANPTAVNFYRKLGYSKLLTGMGKFKNEVIMKQKGFIG